MALILNMLNFVLGGFATTLGWLLATLISAALIITLPYSRSCWEITKMSLMPFGYDIIHVKFLQPTDTFSDSFAAILNLLWFVLFGFWLSLLHVFCGIAQCITVIGIPVGLTNFKLASAALFPVGRRVVPKELAQLAREQAAKRDFEQRRV